MDNNNNNWRPAQAGGAGVVAVSIASGDPNNNNNNNMVDGADWRSQLHPDSRHRIVNKIMDTLEKHLPFSSPYGLVELKKIAVRFEEKIYTAATSQSDYLRKISLKMLTMETKSQNTGVANSIPQNPVASNQNPPDPGLMESNNDWRSELEHGGARQRLVNNIVDTMKLQYPVLSSERLLQLQTSAVTFEQNIFWGATSQSDYFKKISSKMLTEAQKVQDTRVANPLPPNPVVINPNPPSPATTESGQVNTADWQEEAYQKIKAMKEMYLPDLLGMHQKLPFYLQQHETVSQQPKEQIDKIRLMKIYLERIITFLQVSKHNIPLSHRDKLDGYERQIINFLNSNRSIKKPVSGTSCKLATT